MGSAPVSNLNTCAILLVAYVAVFLQAYVTVVRNWIGVQPDLLPVLMVYCGLSTGWLTLTLTAVLGGLWFDSLSANPLGVTVLPLFLVGAIICRTRDLVLRDQPYARVILGTAAGAATPLLTVLLLLASGYKPLLGWGSLWQWLVLALCAGMLTPICFACFDWVNVALAYSRTAESSFRPDREIKRGRV
jgi:rod shape-determining protein MreD